MKRVTARDIYEGYGEGDDEGYEDVEYVLASEAAEREDELKDEIKDLNTELTLANARNQLNPLPGDNMIHDEAEIRRLYAVAREAKERERVLEDELTHYKKSLENCLNEVSAANLLIEVLKHKLEASDG